MINRFTNSSGKGQMGAVWENDAEGRDRALSDDQLAVVWSNREEIISALPVKGSVRGSYDIDIARLPANFNLFEALRMRRESQQGLTDFSRQTTFLTVISDFTERTRILALSGEILSLNDLELLEWLINAEKQMLLGTDNHPVFETSLEETACSVRRLPNGLVAMTEVSRPHVDDIRERMSSIFGTDTVSATNLVIETPLRSVMRYFLTAMPGGARILSPGKEFDVTAFLIITRSGFSYGLWSPSTGLFSEYGFLAPREISQWVPDTGKTAADRWKTDAETAAAEDDDAVEGEVVDDYLNNYIRKAFDQLLIQLSPEKMEELQLAGLARLVWSADPDLIPAITPIAAEYSTRQGIDIDGLDIPLDEAAAGGLLFGSFTFGDETVVGAEILPPVNLARDLLALADKKEVARLQIEEFNLVKSRDRAVFALWAAPVVVFAGLFALIASILLHQIMLSARDYQAEARTLELKPALERRRAYENTLGWYQEFITQVSALRKQQPVGISMLYEINQNLPFTIDPSFYISELKLLPTGSMEMRGLARNKDAVTSFLRALEFAGGTESGSTVFENLTYEVQEGVASPVGQAKTNIPSSELANNNLAPGIIAWSIKGNYSPIVKTLPLDPAKQPPGSQPPPPPPPGNQPPPPTPVPSN